MASPTNSIKIQQHLDLGTISRVVNLPAPIDDNDAVRKIDLQGVSSGIKWISAVRVATTANISLVTAAPSSIDGITMAVNDRVLVKNQINASQNGIYIYDGSSYGRSTDADIYSELVNGVVSVLEGSSNGNTTYRQTGITGTINSTDVIWEQFGSIPQDATETDKGLVRIATTKEINDGILSNVVITPAKLKASNIIKKVYETTSNGLGDGTQTFITVSHGLSLPNKICTVDVYNKNTLKMIMCEVEYIDDNNVTLRFSSAPAAGSIGVRITA